MGNPISSFRSFYKKHLIKTGQHSAFENNIELSTLSPMEQLDAVLKCLAYTKPPIHTAVEIVDTLLFKGFTTNEFEVIIILEKLIDDKNAIKDQRDVAYVSSVTTKRKIWFYSITFSGRTLLSYENGYMGRFKSETLSDALEIKYQRNTRLGVIGAAIFAGLLLIWDITKFLIEKKLCSNCFAELWFYLVLIPFLFCLVYYLIRKLPP